MGLLKKQLLTLLVSTLMLIAAPSVMAGKIEKATTQEVSEAIVETIRLSEEALAAVKNGQEKDQILTLLKETKQSSKRIESNVVDRLRSKANSRVTKARAAIRKGDTATAETLLTEAVAIFKEVQVKHKAF